MALGGRRLEGIPQLFDLPVLKPQVRIALRNCGNILNSGFSFHLKIKEGAGAFVCGEETALMASIEGNRGMPRSRPPFPAQSGLWGKPTNINNVETLANVSAILRKGASWYAGYGTGKTICPHCGVGCSLYLGIRGNEIVDVQGDKESPVNKGGLRQG